MNALDATKRRCMAEWDSVNEPPCHPSDEDWHPCPLCAPWRTGRKVGRTIYVQLGAEPSDDDQLIGLMDSPELAARVVEAVNRSRGEPR